MNTYMKPAVEIVKFDTLDVIASSDLEYGMGEEEFEDEIDD